LKICIYKTLLLHRPDDFIEFTLYCPPHILQQNCAHEYTDHGLSVKVIGLQYNGVRSPNSNAKDIEMLK